MDIEKNHILMIKDDSFEAEPFFINQLYCPRGILMSPEDTGNTLSGIDRVVVLSGREKLSEETLSLAREALRSGMDVDFIGGGDELLCPVCGKYIFSERASYEICPVCGWEDDPVQRKDPSFAGGANMLSLEEARRSYGGYEK